MELFIFWSKGKAVVLQECRVHLKSPCFLYTRHVMRCRSKQCFSFPPPSPWPALRLFHDPSFNESPAPVDWKLDWITWSTLTVNQGWFQRPPGNSYILCVVYTWPLGFHSIYWPLLLSLGIIIKIKRHLMQKMSHHEHQNLMKSSEADSALKRVTSRWCRMYF